jgi:hypothetical protein
VGRGQDRCREHGSSPIDRTTSERVGEQEWSVLRRGQDCLHPLHEEQHPSARGRTDNRQMGGDTAHTHRQDPRYGYGHTTALPRTRCTCCDDRATGGHGAEGTARALAVSPECAIICTRCQYALQPAGEAVSKHLWEKHEVPLNQRVGLNSFVRSLLSARSKYPSLPTRRICTAPALAHTAWVPLHALQIYNNEPKFVAAPHGNKPPDWRQ